MPILEVAGVTVRFGGTVAVSDVAVSVEPGVVTGLIGPNGAGKTTLFNVVSGLQQPSSGRVHLDGRDITTMAPNRRAQLGLARTFQRLELFISMSVRDNIRVAGDIRNARRGSQRIHVDDETDRIIELTGLGDVADRDVDEIPTGRARVVELARALMTGPKVLLLDEPASGQTEQETRLFGALLRRLADQDELGICLVEHDVALVMGVCDTIHVLDYGRIIAVGPPERVRNDPLVVAAYLGAPGEVA
jgi:branched-chain amino acid transport system ATP-binding protein